jgi:hypothetical protein
MMVDSFQILLFVVIIALTSVVTLVGFQIFLILREVQRLVRTTNEVVEDAKTVTGAAAESLQQLTGSLSSIGGLFGFFEDLRRWRKKAVRKEPGA